MTTTDNAQPQSRTGLHQLHHAHSAEYARHVTPQQMAAWQATGQEAFSKKLAAALIDGRPYFVQARPPEHHSPAGDADRGAYVYSAEVYLMDAALAEVGEMVHDSQFAGALGATYRFRLLHEDSDRIFARIGDHWKRVG